MRTSRLLLRPWKFEDFEPFAQLNADPRVMEYFPATLNRQESDQLAKKIQKKIEEKGWGLWAVSVPDIADFIGFIGLNSIDLDFPFAPAVEIGWRLAYDYWGKGYATEGALVCLHFGFETLNLDEIVSFTAQGNIRSQAVMQRLGMHRDLMGDFKHPKLPEGNPLKKHVLYRLAKDEFYTKRAQI
jgi:3-dehydroquinate dehydratase/shikimate dehydrogenase